MIISKEGVIAIQGDYNELLADMYLIMEHFTEVTNDAKKDHEEEVNYMIKVVFENFPETVTNFTKIFVKATH